MGSVRVRAVHDLDLEDVLRTLGLDVLLGAGILGCEFCEEPVDLSRIYALVPLSAGTVSVVCDAASCVNAFLAEYRPQTPVGRSRD
jgi:hypothetical protein